MNTLDNNIMLHFIFLRVQVPPYKTFILKRVLAEEGNIISKNIYDFCHH